MAKQWFFVLLAAFWVSISGIVLAGQALPAGATVEYGFTPKKVGSASALDVVIKAINGAKQQILVAAYEFTSRPVANALIDAQRRGVHVFVPAVADGYAAEWKRLWDEAIPLEKAN